MTHTNAMALSAEVEEAALALWPSKYQTAVLLGVGVKSVERYAKDGLLTSRKRASGRGKPPMVVYNPVDVENVRIKFAKPAALLPPENEPKSVASTPHLGEMVESVVTHLRHIAEAQRPLAVYVPGPDAVRLTGLSLATIREFAKQGTVKVIQFGNGVRFRRADLEAL